MRLRANGIRAALAFVTLAMPAAAQESPRFWGTVGLGQSVIDEEGARHLFRERSDRFEGFAARDVSLHAIFPGLRLDVEAPRLDDVAHDAGLRWTNRYVSGSVRSARTRLFYDAGGGVQSRRDQLTADLRVHATRNVEFFGSHARHDRAGSRVAIDPGDEGELGTSYDQNSTTWRGGLRLASRGNTLQVAYVERQLESDVAPEADRTLHGVEAELRARAHERVRAEAVYARGRTRLDRDAMQLESDRVAGRVDVEVRSGWTLGPTGRFEESSDEALGVRNRLWALGGATRAVQARWDAGLEAEGGQRHNAIGTVDTWGVRVLGGVTPAAGLRFDVRLERQERDRGGLTAPAVPGTSLPTAVLSTNGTLAASRLQARARYRAGSRWSAEALVARLGRDYDDVRVEQRTWRYGLQGRVTPRADLQLQAGWRLDDTADTRPSGAYDLRAHTFFAGGEVEVASRLRLHARIDRLAFSRVLDVGKTFLAAGGEVDVARDLRLGLEYENERYDDDATANEYRAHVWQLVLRQGFRL